MTAARTIALLAAASCIALAACAGNEQTPRDTSPSPRLGLSVDRSSSIDGVELRWWAANDNANGVASAIASVMEHGQVLPSRLADRWDESGLRLVRIPRDKLPALLAAAPPQGQYARDWKGWMGQWLPVFRGPPIDHRATFTIDNRPRLLGPGAPRVLMRAWPAPTALGPVVRLDLAFQFADDTAPIPEGPAAGFIPANTQAIRAGQVINELTAELALDPAYAYLLTCESPGVAWSDPPQSSDAQSPPPDASAPPAPGPAAAPSTTIGQRLFSFSLADSAQKRRIIVVIVPELASDFALLPRRTDQ